MQFYSSMPVDPSSWIEQTGPVLTTATAPRDKRSLYFLAFITVTFVAILTSLPPIRSAITSSSEHRRQILGKLVVSYESFTFLVFKVATESGIELEIFSRDGEGQQKLLQKYAFPDDKEAYLMMNENAENLAWVDVDKDGRNDVVFPTVDRNGYSRLNVLRYDGDLGQFSPMIRDEQ
jgi:hypothetical protein